MGLGLLLGGLCACETPLDPVLTDFFPKGAYSGERLEVHGNFLFVRPQVDYSKRVLIDMTLVSISLQDAQGRSSASYPLQSMSVLEDGAGIAGLVPRIDPGEYWVVINAPNNREASSEHLDPPRKFTVCGPSSAGDAGVHSDACAGVDGGRDAQADAGTTDVETDLDSALWYNEYEYRKRLTIDHRHIEADLQDLPVAVVLEADSDLAASAHPSGSDISFFSESGEMLEHELVSFTSTTGALHAWVRLDAVSSVSDTNFYLAFGSPDTRVREQPSAVWGDCRGVWHLDETNGIAYDSTMHASTGIATGIFGAGPGVVGGAYEIDESGGSITIPDPVDGHLDFGTSESFTVSLWYFRTAESSTWQVLVHKGGLTDYEPGYGIEFSVDGRYFRACADPRREFCVFPFPPPNSTVWHHLAMVVDRGTQTLVLYVDGLPSTTADIAGADPGDGGANENSLSFGDKYDVTTFPLLGGIDEARVCAFAASGARVRAEIANQQSPSLFLVVGPLEASGP